MLVLSRKKQQSIVIDGRIVVTLIDVRPGKVRLGIDAPPDVTIVRTELLERIGRPSMRLEGAVESFQFSGGSD